MNIVVRAKLPPNPTIQQVFDLLLHSRITLPHSPFAIRDYLSPPHPSSLRLTDFGFTQGYVDAAMEEVWRCHPHHPHNTTPHRPIVVYTDYDADGITGGAILWETLHTLGFKAFPYTPNRITEGYGFSRLGLETVKAKYDPALIISVDHGIAADTHVTYAREELGIPIIVTDHHHKQEEKVPKRAVAIFHIPALSGSGVAYCVGKEIANSTKYRVQSTEPKAKENNGVIATMPAMLSHKRGRQGNLGGNPEPDEGRITRDLEQLYEHDYVGIAAIGTIADLVPLQGPSRSIAYHGLCALTDTHRPGLLALKQVSDHIGKTVTTYEVGYLLAPRINASGRLDDALDALRLLCTKDRHKAHNLASKLDSLNRERQDMVKSAVEEATALVEGQRETDGHLPKILILHQSLVQSTGYRVQSNKLGTRNMELGTHVPWHEGIIGLIASKICEKYHRPTIVLTNAEYGEKGMGNGQNRRELKIENCKLYKASCRSIPGFHMTNYLTAHTDLLIKFGGHGMAAGFSIGIDKLDDFIQKSHEYADTHITDEMLERSLTVDCTLPLPLATLELAHMIRQLEPFGVGNPRPVFVSTGLITQTQVMGKQAQHVRFRLVDGTGGIDMVAFNKAQEIQSLGTDHTRHTIVYTLDMNVWNGSEKVQGKYIAVDDQSHVIK